MIVITKFIKQSTQQSPIDSFLYVQVQRPMVIKGRSKEYGHKLIEEKNEGSGRKKQDEA